MSTLAVSLLGSFQATLDGRPITGFESNKVRALLAYLAIESERPHSRDELIGLLWPDQPDAAARANLRQALANLRQVIGDRTATSPFLSITSDSIQFQRSAQCTIDVIAFTELVAACQAHAHRRLETCRSCAQRLQQAAELYRGDFLAQFVQSGSEAFEEWALIQRERLHREMLDALYVMAEHHARRSEYEHVRHYATRQLELDPWREEAHRQLMRALALSGQRSAALAQYEICRRVLAEELGAEPSKDTTTLCEKIKSDDLAHAERRHNLPTSLTPLIGRERELFEIDRLLETPTCRLLTLTGPGGMGKTRLALQAASNQVGLFDAGVWVVELAALSDPALVPQAIASALDLREQSTRSVQDMLRDFLKRREILIVLDNCEHLVDACAQLADDLLRACPQLSILATSREALKIAGEVTFHVPPLTTPDPQHLPARDALLQYDAVRLFSERAKAVLPSFEVNDANAPAVAQLCYHLDGMPLAIELAAARVRGLKVEQIAQRLDDRFRLLTGGGRTALPRHQTLRATIDWSHGLLTEQERILFRRLSVFTGGWTIDAAEAVCAGDGIESSEVLDLLLHLLDKSLILMDGHSAETRYHMLETIREYAHGRLRESSEADPVQQQHLAYFLQFAETDEPERRSDTEKQWRERLEPELDNLRTALKWSLDNDVETGVRLVGVFATFCWGGLYNDEGLDWLRKFLAQPGVSAHTLAQVKVLWAAGDLLSLKQQDNESIRQRRDWYEESLTICRELDELSGVADALRRLGHVALSGFDWESARESLVESLRISQSLSDKDRKARVLVNLGYLSVLQGDAAQAYRFYEESLHNYRELRMNLSSALPLSGLGDLALGEGNLTQARSYHEESLALYREAGREQNGVGSLLVLGEVAAREGKYEEAHAFIERSIVISQEYSWGDGFLGYDLSCLAFLARTQGDYQQSSELYKKSLPLLKDDKSEVVLAVERLAGVSAMQGKAECAITFFGIAAALREAINTPAPALYKADNERDMAVARAQLDEAAFNAAWGAGHAMTMEQAIDYALNSNDKEREGV